MLLDAVTDSIIGKGAGQIVLSTADQNTAAQCLFASAGLRLIMLEMTLDC